MSDAGSAASITPARRGDNDRPPRLGDFDKLQGRTASLPVSGEFKSKERTWPRWFSEGVSPASPTPSDSSLKLGDFRGIVSLLRVGEGLDAPHEKRPLDRQELHRLANISRAASPISHSDPIPIPSRPDGGLHPPSGLQDDDPLSATDPVHESGSSRSTIDASSTPGTTPPEPDFCSAQRPASSQLCPAKRTAARPSTLQQILSYQKTKYGPLIPVYGQVASTAQKHESLMNGLVRHRVLDAENALLFPATTSNGIHVFLDMSNISISFHNALRDRFSVGVEARFVPLPSLNLQFLTEILVRGRSAVSLNVGCSVPPRRAEPRFVGQLRSLGYHVDLRERRPVLEPSVPHRVPRGQAPAAVFATSSSSDEMSSGTAAAAAAVRYVEDLVDEVLQTRIAESVMECFQRQGTIVLATGDAQPAKHSDGFLTYAIRALKMGWNVEVVSWKNSLSSHWRNPAWAANWGTRFRVIELDPFLDELLACPTTSTRSCYESDGASRVKPGRLKDT
ncbi:hypothetical protein JDV02_003644 [Purpureocillium takamizusanense]|uniref:Cell wall glucanase n=1 Tax=Purpureocillium takamizusanense TaxID=2060973 RepID=A0A9Q8QC19_9HYPO|nr:uncharacterized protein JDV02_003644 [Purpureocillium takamizusanense]UNI17288.1 hypothetical protein JDV02_003644 [Purpureocillium takamizusanense]